MTKRWEDALPSHLRARGKKLVDAPGAETAWPIQHAQPLLEWLKQSHYAVLGGDLYESKGAEFLPKYQTWYCDVALGEPWAVYTERSCNEALQHIGKAKQEYWVVLVASLKPTEEQTSPHLVKRR